MTDEVVQVAVAVIRTDKGVLISRRAETAHQGGLWEFPGGKLEANESVEQALQREIQEELGLKVTNSEPLLKVEHNYSDKRVVLHVRLVTDFSGEAKGREGQPIRWATLSELKNFKFPAANVAILDALLVE